ncbi:hypothetical protein AB0B28_17825, partial [Glycomyces sp. NPDC046736]|uniref:hypothetical protein n=1 Tax=Glycomyces sp. NPDC046736 TaxID=3155615 RepID=UPI0033C29E10
RADRWLRSARDLPREVSWQEPSAVATALGLDDGSGDPHFSAGPARTGTPDPHIHHHRRNQTFLSTNNHMTVKGCQELFFPCG